MIEKLYIINANPYSSRKPQANETIEIIHEVIGNLLQLYNPHETSVDDADPCMGILASAAFVVRSTYHRNKGKSPGQLVFVQDITTPINQIADCKYIKHL